MKKFLTILALTLMSVVPTFAATKISIPENVTVMQTITFEDNTVVTVYYQKTGDTVTAYSEDTKGKTVESVLSAKKSSVERVQSVPKSAKKLCSYKVKSIINRIMNYLSK